MIEDYCYLFDPCSKTKQLFLQVLDCKTWQSSGYNSLGEHTQIVARSLKQEYNIRLKL